MSNLVQLRSYFDPEEAYVVRGALQAADIDAVLFGDPFCTSFPHLRLASGGYRLSVPASQESRAREALGDLESFDCREPIGADAPCATCGGRNFRRERSWRWAIIAFYYGAGLAAHSRRSRCLSCGAVIDTDRRQLLERAFFFLSSMALLVWISGGWRQWLYLLFSGQTFIFPRWSEKSAGHAG
jgi:hypothetical protein